MSSTGIYCRFVCRAKTPKRENCTFFATAAEAEAAGYRPCLTCRPETAPGTAVVDASANLARRAAALIHETCTDPQSVERLAARLGYTDRHLRRVFEAEYAVSPSQYLQTCRLHLAKALLTDSGLPVSAVAAASGFGSVRRFNDVFKKRYALTPSSLRKRKGGQAATNGGVPFRLGYRAPYRFDDLLGFFRSRQIEGVERVDGSSYERVVRIEAAEGEHLGWVRVEVGREGLVFAFPTFRDILAIPSVEDAFGELGVIRNRSRVIAEIARKLAEGELDLSVSAVVAEQVDRLLSCKGIGPWTANYMAMRIFGHPDVFLEGDAGIKHALPDLSPQERLALAEQWRPWRSYANLCLWNSLSE